MRNLEGTQHTCLRLEPREMVQTSLLELVGRGDSDSAGDSATRQSVTGYHCDVQNVDVQPKSEADCNQSQFLWSRVLRRQCLRWRIVGTRRTLQGTSLRRCRTSRDGLRLGKTHSFYRAGDRVGLEHIEIRCLAIQQWIRYQRLSVSWVDTQNNTADLFTKHLDGLRTQSLAKKLGLRILDGTDGTNGTNDNGWEVVTAF